MPTPSIYTGTIREITPLTEHVLHITCTLPEKTALEFAAGQYATVIIDQKTRRQYSFCSDPKQTHEVSFVVDTTPGGPGSRFFQEKRVGEEVQFLAPLGLFVLHKTTQKTLFVATGTGIAPIRSMILAGVATTPMTLYWGLRHEEDVYWDREFTNLAARYPTFHYHLVLSQPTPTWKGMTGHVTEFVKLYPGLPDITAYLCGNNHMVAEVTQLLVELQVPPEAIYTELF